MNGVEECNWLLSMENTRNGRISKNDSGYLAKQLSRLGKIHAGYQTFYRLQGLFDWQVDWRHPTTPSIVRPQEAQLQQKRLRQRYTGPRMMMEPGKESSNGVPPSEEGYSVLTQNAHLFNLPIGSCDAAIPSDPHALHVILHLYSVHQYDDNGILDLSGNITITRLPRPWQMRSVVVLFSSG